MTYSFFLNKFVQGMLITHCSLLVKSRKFIKSRATIYESVMCVYLNGKCVRLFSNTRRRRLKQNSRNITFEVNISFLRQKSRVCFFEVEKEGESSKVRVLQFMAEEAPNSDIKGSNVDQNQNSVEANVESQVQGGTESTCNNAESSSVPSFAEREKPLEYAEELMDLGSKASKERDYAEATDYYSCALEIKYNLLILYFSFGYFDFLANFEKCFFSRVSHFGELAPECVNAYYKYGCALLYKAQEEADPLGAVPKKEAEAKVDSDKDGSVKSGVTAESSVGSVASDAGEGGNSGTPQEKEKGLDIDGMSSCTLHYGICFPHIFMCFIDKRWIFS